jgi:hypothetical protein
MTVRDPEVLAELRDEPELLAVADALAEALRREPLAARRRRASALAALTGAVSVAALAALVLVFVLRGGEPGVVDRALAAVGDGPVLHAIVREDVPADSTLVEIATGRRLRESRVLEIETWFDEARGLKHTITRTNGRLTDDELQTPEGTTARFGPVWTCARIARHPIEATRARVSCNQSGENGTTPRDVPEPPATIDPALGGFASSYRGALASGSPRQAGEGVVDGRPVYWLEFQLPAIRDPGPGGIVHEQSERVAIARDTYRPLLVRFFLDGVQRREYSVVTIESVSERAADFSRPQPVPPGERVSSGDVVSEEEIGLGEARSALAIPALWAGAEIGELKLSLVKRQQVRTSYAEDAGVPARTGTAIELVYGDVSNGHATGDFVQLEESTAPEFAFGWVPERYPTAPDGFIRFTFLNWGFLRRDGLYVRISASGGEDVVLAAARRLAPIPSG